MKKVKVHTKLANEEGTLVSHFVSPISFVSRDLLIISRPNSFNGLHDAVICILT